jgi:hypothetical protein
LDVSISMATYGRPMRPTMDKGWQSRGGRSHGAMETWSHRATEAISQCVLGKDVLHSDSFVSAVIEADRNLGMPVFWSSSGGDWTMLLLWSRSDQMVVVVSADTINRR